MLGLITDRTQGNVDYLRALSRKGWANMTPYERAMWTGDPLTAADCGYTAPVNLLSNGPYHGNGASLSYRNSTITATATVAGAYSHAVSIIGDASDYEGIDVTLSVDSVTSLRGYAGLLQLVWYDDDGTFVNTECALTGSGVVTATLDNNESGLAYLAIVIYVCGKTVGSVGDYTVYSKVMLEKGGIRHDYVPYTPILPTEATKGAYNYSDLNRVERVVEELSERWGLGLVTKTDWGLWDVPTASDMSRFRDNLVAIENYLRMEEVMGDIPSDLSRLTFARANAIENFLLEVSEEV